MKLLLDNCVDWRLQLELTSHEVVHARSLGWEGLTNGNLLASAEAAGFQAIITVDKNFRFQQSSVARSISLVTLEPVLTKLAYLKPLVPQLLAALDTLEPGVFLTVGSSSN